MTSSILFSTMLTVAAVSAGLASAHSVPLSIYASMAVNELEGEYNGLEVALLFYNGRTEVLWWSANGSLEKPLLIETRRAGTALTLSVPEGNQLHGNWRLELHQHFIQADGPRDL